MGTFSLKSPSLSPSSRCSTSSSPSIFSISDDDDDDDGDGLVATFSVPFSSFSFSPLSDVFFNSPSSSYSLVIKNTGKYMFPPDLLLKGNITFVVPSTSNLKYKLLSFAQILIAWLIWL